MEGNDGDAAVSELPGQSSFSETMAAPPPTPTRTPHPAPAPAPAPPRSCAEGGAENPKLHARLIQGKK